MCAKELKTRTSKNAHCLSFPQNPCALMSRRAPSSMLAVLLVSLSSVTGCSTGSVPTLWQMSLMRCALISLISLWQIDGKPP